jgi:hypothetical protein
MEQLHSLPKSGSNLLSYLLFYPMLRAGREASVVHRVQSCRVQSPIRYLSGGISTSYLGSERSETELVDERELIEFSSCYYLSHWHASFNAVMVRSLLSLDIENEC